MHKQKKKRAYDERIREVDRACFSLCVEIVECTPRCMTRPDCGGRLSGVHNIRSFPFGICSHWRHRTICHYCFQKACWLISRICVNYSCCCFGLCLFFRLDLVDQTGSRVTLTVYITCKFLASNSCHHLQACLSMFVLQ